MPIIDMPVKMLLERVSAGEDRPPLDTNGLVELLPRLGCEVEELAQVEQYVCRLCDKAYDRTEAQGPPLACTHCGADFRAAPQHLQTRGAAQVLRLHMLAVRPDIFDPGGMARYIRGFLGLRTGCIEYPVDAPRLRVQVDSQLALDESYRPFIACAVVRGVQLDNDTIKMVMNLQEDLHWALGRDRKLASIGVYDLDTLEGEVFHYDAVDPDGLRFVPLGFDPQAAGSALTPREILEQHKTGQAYAQLLKPLKKYPLLRDGAGTVLSMPPIINSESTRVTLSTQNFFVDVTGLSQRTVERALNIVVTSLKEILPQVRLEAVVIEGRQAGTQARRHEGQQSPSGSEKAGKQSPSGSEGPSVGTPNASERWPEDTAVRITPDLSPVPLTLDVRQAADMLGTPLNAAELAELLESMGHGAEEAGHADKLQVLVPAYRNDVMHPVDLIEDAAIAHGFENLTPSLVPTFTVGAPRAVEERSAVARRVLTGLGFHQVMTLVLTSAPAAFEKWRLPVEDARAVLIANPISSEQTMCRVSLLPGLMETLAINKQYDLPQQIFEVGDCCFVDNAAETGAREDRYAAAGMIGTHVGYADMRAVVDAFTHEMGIACRVAATEHPSFIPGRVAALVDAEGAKIGTLGELHPEVLERYGLKHPVALMELRLVGA